MATRLLSITPVEIVPRNLHRKSLIFQNEDAAEVIYIKRERAETPTVSATDHDHRLAPGGLLSLNFGTDGIQSTQDRWTAVAGANTPRISYFETEDVQR